MLSQYCIPTAHVYNIGVFPQTLLNMHGDLYFLLHNFGVQILSSQVKTLRKKIFSEGKKDIANKRAQIKLSGALKFN